MHAAETADTTLQRWGFRIQGAVQGVGFRPWCVRQAQELGLHGWVRNDGQGLALSLQGPLPALQALDWRLRHRPPALARIRTLTHWPEPLQTGPDEALQGCRILPSPAAASPEAAPATSLPPDTAPCADCLDELFDPADRRWRHPFINCTQCGPRWSVTARLPYDRPHTSLAGFALCPACATEYHDPADRRHHAQPTACPACGPQLALWTPQGQPLDGEGEPLAAAVARLRAGQVLAVKGVGGYHLVCDALQAAPLARLRAAKQRASKPFALLAPNRASAERWVDLSLGHDTAVADAVAAQLQSPRRPILLLPCRPGVAAAHPEVAPGLTEWGLMLPPSPLHELLCHRWLGQPAGDGWRHAAHPGLLWVMTSANPGGEPLVIDEAEALQHLAGLADALLVHNRPILGRLDDSVARPMPPLPPPPPPSMPPGPDAAGAAQLDPDAPIRAAAVHIPFVRRARGWVPEPIALPAWAVDAPPVLATGGWLKNTVCLTRRGEAFLSAHVGDLGSAASRAALVQAQQRLGQFLGVQPQAVAHDLHPDFFSTQHAQTLAAAWGVPAVPVQHHHAHAAAVLAEHGHPGPALALVLDGTGLGTDGSVWGGELLRLDAGGARCTRLAHLPALHLPGGDRAASEPWRLAAGLLAAAGRAGEVAARFPGQPGAGPLAALLARGRGAANGTALAGPRCTSAGRWFDAAAALLLGHGHNRYEGEGALRLESLAAQAGGLAVAPWSDAWLLDDQGRLHWPGLLQRLLDAPPPPAGGASQHPADLAAAFHHSLVQAWVAWVVWHAQAQGLGVVALGGGCLINRWLREGLVAGLQAARLQVLEAVQAPPGDGGLSLGQALVAVATVAPFAPAAADPAGPGLLRPAPSSPFPRS